MNVKGHICYLANAASIHTVRWVNYFVEHGWKVDLITWHPPASNSMIHPDVVVHRIFSPPHYIARYGALLEITRLISKIQPDIIHAFYTATFGILVGLYERLSGFRPIIITELGPYHTLHSKGLKKWLINYAFKKADLITCDGQNSKDAMIDLGINPEKIKIIYHGVDTKKFNPNQRNRELIRNLFSDDNYSVVISARSLAQNYDVETLIKAIPSIQKKIANAKFIIGGKGPGENYLKKLAESLVVSNSISFVGYIPHDDLPKYLASSDVYVSTSLSDGGVAVATLDAMACELAPVVTDVADNSKWIKDGENGFIIPIQNPEALAEKVIYLLENKEIRRRFGEINRKKIEERQEYTKNMEEMERLYRELIREKSL